ncbi:hypothetical protein ARALYDRAFT_900294 [Arabidopsis lyrata subsp. lyrata]|uniref:Reverse transcriptase zinc-binding domain-containing protein n=1 Tax=Arabidopsis lyrata subsp. lyrata TaxID=81972 RepID=D7L156_ARALL|nr:hypothetical protein ARALYDRAFT_900294 [Arabidopsis lyrata subsp. lyrata]
MREKRQSQRTETAVPHTRKGNDKFLWRNIRVRSPLVPRAKVVWNKECVPRFSLIAWMSLLARFPKRMG